MKIVDLSKTIAYNKQDPWFMRIKIKHKSHQQSKFLIRFFLGLPARLFPKGFEGWADDKIVGMGVHAATHIDAPWHYSPTVNGAPAKTIDEIPLEWCYGEGIVVDMTHKADLEEITVADIRADLEKSGAVLKPGTIVLIRTGRDQYIGTREYPMRGAGMSAAATHWLIDQGIKVIGIDQWGFDLPLKYMAQTAKKQNRQDYFWQAHLVGQEKEYCHIEQLVNLGALPAYGFKVSVLPLKIKGASAAPARVVAIFE
ncbi:cyclase family protein [Chitinophaga nivalis]|uniref:Cyclase family protein n=1 Tax=Chitinophaga nivalis TaxID=2991709 RepID=A0ABT3IS01_9BACT|nr:cyclase family protein [Chitinophaga nivalis]MCW3463557.1 cyclase family protein [Chitinophaga nivalis]MCW3486753.1 cyclase family protein [Chitinophaga nivalis]